MIITAYEPHHGKEWDKFIYEDSINGTFLQSRNFLSYHPPQRFQEASLLLHHEKGHIMGVVSGCALEEEGKRIFFSHKGSTFGGIVLHGAYYQASTVLSLLDDLEEYWKREGFDRVVLKQTPNLFSKVPMDLLEYALWQKGYEVNTELSTYVDFHHYKEDVLLNFSQSKRSYIRNVCKKEQRFQRLETLEEVSLFYDILCENLKKYHSQPVHTLEELIEFKKERLKENIAFYGVYEQETLLSGMVVFFFGDSSGKTIAHTQYLATNPDFLNKQPMMYLSYCFLEAMKQEGIEKVSWGISTEQQGKELNLGLIRAKESYGSLYSNNRTFMKNL